MSASPITFTYEGDGAFRAASPFWAKRADRAYVIGANYEMVEQSERSQKSHNHFFAAIASAWESLPDDLKERWPSAEHLRKHCLIARGFCDVTTVTFSNNSNAFKAAELLRPLDEYALIDVRGDVLIRAVAQSQSRKAMGGERFQTSKNAVLEEIATILGATPEEIADAARSAA